MFCNPPIKHYIFLLIRAPLLYNEQGGFFMFLIDIVQEMVNTGAQQIITWVTQLLPQIFLFLLTSLHTLVLSTKTSAEKKVRYRAIGAFGIVMTALIAVQIYNPLLPVYSVGCMLGTCMLHTFIYEDEKAEYRIKLEKLLQV